MEKLDRDLLPPARLALAYAPPELRSNFALLLCFDTRIANVICKGSETLITQMKLAWWREAIAKPPAARPQGEPLLARLTQLADARIDQAFQALLVAWEEILLDDAWRAQTLESFAKARGNAVFSTYAAWVGFQQEIESLGTSWAIGDLQLRTGRIASALPQLITGSVPRDRRIRPLTILTLSVREISGPRLLWHALTGH